MPGDGDASSGTRTILVTGASGFVGTRVAAALSNAGYAVRAMTRRPEAYHGAGRAVTGDVSDVGSLQQPLAGVDTAYYLIHALDSDDFERKDAAAARAFGRAAAEAGVNRIIYLGGLGEDAAELSAHLRSRREVEGLLGEAGVPVTVLRAAVIIGPGGISWEITRQLAERLPVMLTPRWVETRVQPIALRDVVRYLVAVLEQPETVGKTYEVGGADVLRYVDMLKTTARLLSGRRLPVVTLPLLTPRLSAEWLAVVTDVNLRTARNLVDSMTNEVVVHDDAIRALVPWEPVGFEDAVRLALDEMSPPHDRRHRS
jgi:uncharacterized protein YbjT (DUF2867 family)